MARRSSLWRNSLSIRGAGFVIASPYGDWTQQERRRIPGKSFFSIVPFLLRRQSPLYHRGMRFLLFFLAGLALARDTAIVLRTSTLIDGKGNVLKNQYIVVNGSRIASIGGGPPGGAAVNYDLREQTVMPGWIDTHVHLDWHFDQGH